MNNNRNQLMNNKGLSVNNSLTHLLESNDTDDDGEANLIKHLSFGRSPRF